MIEDAAKLIFNTHIAKSSSFEAQRKPFISSFYAIIPRYTCIDKLLKFNTMLAKHLLTFHLSPFNHVN